MSEWKFVLTDLQGAQLGELTDAHARSLVLPLSRLPTAQCTLRLDHPLAAAIMTADVMLKAYRDGALRFIGPLVSAEESGQANQQTVAATFAGAFWRLQKRLIGTTNAGIAYGTVGTPLDRVEIARRVLSDVNATYFTGVSQGTFSNAGTTTVLGPVFFKPAADAIVEMAHTFNGFDFEIVPTEPTSVGQAFPQIGVMNTQSLIGTAESNAIFEYGEGQANVAEYKRQVTMDTLMNFGYAGTSGGVTTQAVLTSADLTSFAARGRYDDFVQTDLVNDSLRQALLDEHIRVRKQPRQIITFTPYRDASPQPFVDYILGDQVRARATVEGAQRFDVMCRVYSITFNIDDVGAETVDLELIPPVA